MRVIAFDPYVPRERAKEMGIELMPTLEALLVQADFVSIHLPRTVDTEELIGEREFALMKEGARLVNTARGGIVNEEALCAALKHKRIAGAASDVYAAEPAGREHPFTGLDNIILAPHCIAWTDELFSEIGMMAANIALEIGRGQVPAKGVVNREVLERPGFQRKLRSWKGD